MNKEFTNSKNTLCIRRLNDINSPLHFHDNDEIEIMIMLYGSAECIISGKKYTINTGEAIIVTRYQPHSYHNASAVDTISFIFRRNTFPELFSFFDGHSLIDPTININNTKRKIGDIINCLLNDLAENQNDDLIMESYTQIIVSKMIGTLKQLNTQNSVFSQKSSFLEKAQRYCFKNYANDLSISEIAKHVNVHPNYLSSAFKAHYGTSLLHYINICRLQHAYEMIASKNNSITDIAYNCGFQSIRSFNRIFKEEIGCTPKEYQNKYQKRTKAQSDS